jgi:hypothetical protein
LVRFAVALVGIALAIRLAIDLIAPVAGYVLVTLALAGIVITARWWRNRW